MFSKFDFPLAYCTSALLWWAQCLVLQADKDQVYDTTVETMGTFRPLHKSKKKQKRTGTVPLFLSCLNVIVEYMSPAVLGPLPFRTVFYY